MVSLTRIAASSVAVQLLAEPIVFRNGKKTKNRIIKAPMTEKLYDWSVASLEKRGIPSQSMRNLYSKWGNGGFGMIVTGSFGVHPKYVSEAGQGIVCRENMGSPEPLEELSRALKSDGALAIAQIAHPGARAIKDYHTSPSVRIDLNENVENPVEFSKQRLQEDVVSRFAYSASTLHKGGFDGVEILAAHGSIFNQFLTTGNQRDDGYGGSLKDRARLLFDVYNAIRREVPDSSGFLVGVKLNSRDFQDSEESKNDVIQLCELIEAAGFDFIEVTGGMMEMSMKDFTARESTAVRENYFVDFVKMSNRVFKNTVVYITGGWQTAGSMVSSVEMGLTKGVGLARWSAAEPDFPKKLLAGETASSPPNQFPPFDFWYMKNAALWHLRSLSETEYDPEKGASSGVTDFNAKEECVRFQKTCDEYKATVEPMGGINQHVGVLDYTLLDRE